MAKNIKNPSVFVKMKRSMNEPYMPYIANSKLDHAMYELRNSQNKLLKLKKLAIIEAAVIILLGVLLYAKF
jgi:hypothetical protein